MFDFPNAPTNGQLVQGGAGQFYAWDGAKWVGQMPPGPLPIASGGTGAITGALALDGLSGVSGATAGALQRSSGGVWSVSAVAPLPVTVPYGGTGAVTLSVSALGFIPPFTTALLHGQGTNPVITGTANWTIQGGRFAGAEISMISAISGASNMINMFKGEGTLAAPTNAKSGLVLGAINFGGYDGTYWQPSSSSIQSTATQDWTGSARGSEILFQMTSNGSTFPTGSVRFTGAGGITATEIVRGVQLAANQLIGLNATWNGTNWIATTGGYAGYFNFDPGAGALYFGSTNASVSGGATATTATKLWIDKAGALTTTMTLNDGTLAFFRSQNAGVRFYTGGGFAVLQGVNTDVSAETRLDINASPLNFGSVYSITANVPVGYRFIVANGTAQFMTNHAGTFEIKAASSNYAELDLHVPGIRIWSVVVHPSGPYQVIDQSAPGAVRIQINLDGACYSTNGTWNSLSDVRTKRDIEDYTRGLADLVKLRPVTFRYNGEGGTVDDDVIRYGLVAQEALPIVPEIVSQNGEMLGVDNGRLIYAVLNSLREIDARLARIEGTA